MIAGWFCRFGELAAYLGGGELHQDADGSSDRDPGFGRLGLELGPGGTNTRHRRRASIDRAAQRTLEALSTIESVLTLVED